MRLSSSPLQRPVLLISVVYTSLDLVLESGYMPGRILSSSSMTGTKKFFVVRLRAIVNRLVILLTASSKNEVLRKLFAFGI